MKRTPNTPPPADTDANASLLFAADIIFRATHRAMPRRLSSASSEPCRILELPAEVLAVVAEHIVRNGEAYWFAATSGALRTAVTDACVTLKIRVPTSRLRHVFVSLARLRGTLDIPRVREIVHANVDAPGAEHRARSLDRRYTWSPAGERALVAGAPVDVMHYAWAFWWSCSRGVQWPLPADPRVLASELGRADLLDIMFDANESQLRQAMTNVNKTGYSGDNLNRRCIEECVLGPALAGELNALQTTVTWYYDRMERIEDEWCHAEAMNDCRHSAWRRDYAEPNNLQRLAVEAACGKRPFSALETLLCWIYPRLGERAPSGRLVALQCLQAVALCAVAGVTRASSRRITALIKTTNLAPLELWDWLSSSSIRFNAASLVTLVNSFHKTSGLWRPSNVSRGELVGAIFRITNVETYRWWRSHMDGVFLEGIWKLAAERGQPTISHAGTAVVDKKGSPLAALAYTTLQGAQGPMCHASTIEEGIKEGGGEELLVEAMVDLLVEQDDPASSELWADAPYGLQTHHATMKSMTDICPRLVLKVLGIFSKRVGDSPRRTATFGRVMPSLLVALFDSKDARRKAEPDGQLEGIESISALRALYIEKQEKGWKELGDDRVEQVVQLL